MNSTREELVDVLMQIEFDCKNEVEAWNAGDPMDRPHLALHILTLIRPGILPT